VQLSAIEKEVIVLKAIKELIDSIVNYEVITLSDGDPDAEIRFHSMTHAKFFNIVLVDLLSKTDKRGFLEPAPYLTALRKVTERPHFDVDGSVEQLREVTQQFVAWLEATIEMKDVWLPSVLAKTTLKLTRLELVKTAGNICRHNFLRAVGVAEDVRMMLEASGVSISTDQALQALSDLYEWLHSDVFHYHSSTLAEFLNNIRWGIYQYLQPEYQRSIVREDPPRYRYTIPEGISGEFAKECYWELMNDVRSPPYMRRFQVTRWLKLRY